MRHFDCNQIPSADIVSDAFVDPFPFDRPPQRRLRNESAALLAPRRGEHRSSAGRIALLHKLPANTHVPGRVRICISRFCSSASAADGQWPPLRGRMNESATLLAPRRGEHRSSAGRIAIPHRPRRIRSIRQGADLHRPVLFVRLHRGRPMAAPTNSEERKRRVVWRGL